MHKDHDYLLSIIVPCFNVEKFVNQCLTSIQAQTYKNFEVICVNDGSKDNTVEVIKRFCSQDQRFRLIDKPNSGYGDSMNVGLSQAKGDYIGIIESDDYIEPTMFEELVDAAQRYDLEIARAGFYYSYADKEIPELFPYVIKHVILKPIDNPSTFYQPPSIWASVYRRDFLVKNNIKFLPTKGASFQDTSFAFKCYYKCSRFMLLQNCFVHYRQHENNSVYSDGKLFAVCEEWDEIIRYVKEDSERFKKVQSFLPALITNTYAWNYQRLTAQGRRQFIKRWGQDIAKYEEMGIKPTIQMGKKKFVQYVIVRNFPLLYSFSLTAYKLFRKFF